MPENRLSPGEDALMMLDEINPMDESWMEEAAGVKAPLKMEAKMAMLGSPT